MKKFLIRQKQVLFFIIAGGVCAMVEIGTFKLFSVSIPKFLSWETDFYGIHFPLSNIFSTLIAIVFNYFLSIWFVFERGKHSKKREFAYFMLISFLSTLLSLSFFQVFFRFLYSENMDIGVFVLSPEILSKISAIVLVSVLNYSVKKKVIFNG